MAPRSLWLKPVKTAKKRSSVMAIPTCGLRNLTLTGVRVLELGIGATQISHRSFLLVTGPARIGE
tara:strand:+ start:585 stop:779 length:195 start_codon:yes stop_codon:yes gene_type:complete